MKMNKILILTLLLFSVIGLCTSGVSARKVTHSWGHAEAGDIICGGVFINGKKMERNAESYFKSSDGDATPPEYYFFKHIKWLVQNGYAVRTPGSSYFQENNWAITITNKSTYDLKGHYFENYQECNWLVGDWRIRQYFNTPSDTWKNPF